MAAKCVYLLFLGRETVIFSHDLSFDFEEMDIRSL